MKQQTLITLYGPKEETFRDYLQQLQSMIQDAFPEKIIRPYLPEQIHGTLIGLETKEIDGIPYNLNILEKEGKKCRMRPEKIPDLVKRYFPMTIRFGGFAPDDDPFLSRGEKPFYRSFRLDLQNNRVLILGWPHVENDFSGCLLWKFREAMRSNCNAAHKYEVDNDFYVVLGEVRQEEIAGLEEQIREPEERLRKYLEQHPIDSIIHEVCIAGYTDPRLPPQSTDITKV